MSTISAIFRFDDAPRTIEFLERAFGFRRGPEYADDDGRLVHAELWHGDSCVMVGTRGVGEAGGLPNGTVYIAVDDVDAHHARAVEAGAEVVRPLADQDYGSREYSARDPEGNEWSFGTYRPQPPA